MTRRVLIVLVTLQLALPACSRKAENPTASSDASRPKGDAPKSVVTGTAPPASGGLVSIILLEPRSALSEVEGPPREPVPSADPKVVDQFGQAFFPALLIVQRGQPVEFRNSEDTLHNVRVYHAESREPAFNVSLTPFGKYAYTFDRPGFYAVGCDIHPAMAADILVTSTPYAAIAENDGQFKLTDVPAGSYTVVLLHGGKRTERQVTIAAPHTNLNLTASE